MENLIPQNDYPIEGNIIIVGENENDRSPGNVEQTQLQAMLSSHAEISDTISSPQFLFSHYSNQILSYQTTRACMQGRDMGALELGLPSAAWKMIPRYQFMKCGCAEQQVVSRGVELDYLQAHAKGFLMFGDSAGKGGCYMLDTFLPKFVEEFGDTPHASLRGRSEDHAFLPIDPSVDNLVKASGVLNASADDAFIPISIFGQEMDESFPAFRTMGEIRICNTAVKAENSDLISIESGNEQNHSDVNSSNWHENTADIDALLDSDDEADEEVISTGHFPDDGLLHEASRSYSCDSYSVERVSNDSKWAVEPSEAESTQEFHAEAAAIPELLTRSFHRQAVIPICKEYGSHDICLQNVNPHHVANQAQSHSNPALKLRGGKIKRTIKTLRKIIPGGNGMDAAAFLDEAIQYLTSLRRTVHGKD